MTIHGILPAAGQAMRLRRLPKFLLPCDEEAITLIEKHIEQMSDICEVIWLPVRPDLISLVHDLNLGAKIIPVALSTNTMSETVLRIGQISGADKFLLGMPDTAFVGQSPYVAISQLLDKASLALALWKTAPSQRGKVGAVEIQNQKIVSSIDKDVKVELPFHWGAMAFERKFFSLLEPEMPHTGYVIKKYIERHLDVAWHLTDGDYFDCGTFSEYRRFLRISPDSE
jgi:hypothetical protein